MSQENPKTILYSEKQVFFVGDYGAMYSQYFSSNKFYEFDFLKYIESLNLEGEYLDIGGNIGNHTLFFSMFCPSTHVYVFEPLKRYVDYINNNIKANNIENKVTVFNLGLSNDNCPLQFSMGSRVEEIHPKALDDINISFQKICLIKIDVEGSEDKVLSGALKTIQKYRPRIFCEALDSDSLNKIDTILFPLGYTRSNLVFNASPTYEYIYD